MRCSDVKCSEVISFCCLFRHSKGSFIGYSDKSWYLLIYVNECFTC